MDLCGFVWTCSGCVFFGVGIDLDLFGLRWIGFVRLGLGGSLLGWVWFGLSVGLLVGRFVAAWGGARAAGGGRGKEEQWKEWAFQLRVAIKAMEKRGRDNGEGGTERDGPRTHRAGARIC